MNHKRTDTACILQILLLFLPLANTGAQATNEVVRREGSLMSGLLDQGVVRFYGDEREQDFLRYPFSPIEFYIGVSMWQDNEIVNYSRPFPGGVQAVTFEELLEERPYFLQLGSYYRPEGVLSYSSHFEYRRFSQAESVNVRDGAEGYSIRRNYRYWSYGHQFAVGLNWKNFTFSLGINSRLLREKQRGTEEFVFSNLDGLEAILPGSPSIMASEDEVRVFREPTTPFSRLDYINVSVFWGITYRLKINNNLFAELNTTNPFDPGLGFFSRLTGIPVEDEPYWQEHFSLWPFARQLKSRDYFSLRLGYNLNRTAQIKRKLGFDSSN